MAVFSYKAAGEGGGVRAGTISADTARQARDRLRERGLRVRDIAEVRAGAAGGQSPVARAVAAMRGRPEGKLVAAYRQLSTLLEAGIPLLDALDALSRQSRGDFRQRLLLLQQRVAGGGGLAEAMRQQPDLFDRLSVSMVEVGERSGTLGSVLEQLASFKQRAHMLKGKLATAMIYPAIVVIVGVFVSVLLMTFIVPQLLDALVEAGQRLPLPTRVVKGLSDLILNYWWAMLTIAAAGGAGGWLIMRRPGARRLWHRVQLRLPLVGDLVARQAIVRFAVTLAVLTRSGVEFVQALAIVRQSMTNQVVRDALKRCEEAVAAGRDIAPSLESTGVFPPTVVQIVDVGQASGRLDAMLDRLAADYDQQVQTATQRLLAVFEPAIILALAGGVLFVVLSILLPYLEAGNVL
ncbi:MAG: type II secretion system F family protein [Phycisphaeraceae bacterium]